MPELAALVERAEADTSLVRAEQLANLAGVSLRTLQRRFHSHVRIGPKWVVQRFRLLDVTAAAHGDDPVDWAELAARLGYADQSHLIRPSRGWWPPSRDLRAGGVTHPTAFWDLPRCAPPSDNAAGTPR